MQGLGGHSGRQRAGPSYLAFDHTVVESPVGKQLGPYNFLVAGLRHHNTGELKMVIGFHYHIHGIYVMPSYENMRVLHEVLDVNLCPIHSAEDLWNVDYFQKLPHGLFPGTIVFKKGNSFLFLFGGGRAG